MLFRIVIDCWKVKKVGRVKKVKKVRKVKAETG